MSASLKEYKSELNVLYIHFKSLNGKFTIAKEAIYTYLLSQESKLKFINLQLNWCPPKWVTLVLKQTRLQYLTIVNFLGLTKIRSDFNLQ